VHHRLRIAREWAGLEQGELADRIGISRQSVGSAERGRSHPRRITLNAWALACARRGPLKRRKPPTPVRGWAAGSARGGV